MTYLEFKEKFAEALKTQLKPLGAEIEQHQVRKVNGVMDWILIKYPGSSIAPTIYFEDQYQRYQDGYSVPELAALAANQFRESLRDMPQVPELTEANIRANAYCSVIGAADNTALLNDIPNERVSDMAVIVRCKAGENGSFIITNDICRNLHITSEEVLEAAHRNTERESYACVPMAEMLRDVIIGSGVPEEYIDDMIQEQHQSNPLWVLTNESRIDGASVVISQRALRNARGIIGEDFYILPSSRHEVIALPKSHTSDIESLRQMVTGINASVVSPQDKLTDNVYFYDGTRIREAMEALQPVQEMTMVQGRSR